MFNYKSTKRVISAFSIVFRNQRQLSSLPNDYIIKSRRPSLNYTRGNLTKILFQNFPYWKDSVALKCIASGREITYPQLIDQSARWSGFLRRLGLQTGDVIAIYSPNYPEYAPVFLGTAAIGVVLSTMSSTLTSGEITHMFKINKPKLVVYGAELEANLLEALKEVQQNPTLISIGPSKKGSDVIQLLKDQNIPFQDPLELSGEETMLMPFSSGTTGLPKGACLSQNAFTINTHQMAAPHYLPPRDLNDPQQDSSMALLPVAHIGGMLILMNSLRNGMKITTLPKMNPENFFRVLIGEKMSHLIGVPTLLNLLANRPECSPKVMPHLKRIYCGGSPVPLETVALLKQKLGEDTIFQEFFGMTETLLTHFTAAKESNMRLLPDVEAKVIDLETGKVLPPNSHGEICVKSPCAMQGYVDNPEATDEVLKDGWVHTGDVGYYDEEEYFFIVDRLKDFIKVKALQVSPSEIEQVLLQHPMVRECSVVGVEDDLLGEAPKAFVAKRGEVTEGEIHDFLKTRLAKHKQLAGGIQFVEDFPKTPVGKILKRELKKIK